MRNSSVSCLIVLLFASGIALGQGTKLPIQQAIEAKYGVTKPTADHKDIVTAGAVIDLTKDNLIMYGVDSSVAANSTYKGGRFQASGMSKLQNWNNHLPKIGNTNANTNRTFVAGEKFWLIGVDVRDDGAVLEFLSDAISDVRYKAFVKYPFPNGTIPAPDVVMQEIGETIKAEPTDGVAKDEKQPAPAAAAASAAPAPAMADIPPPPPPTDAPAAAPKSISLGQTKDEVAASFGQPSKIVKLPTKEIDYYPDMKVTFVKGKVSDVQ